jgi:hypothetical protein
MKSRQRRVRTIELTLTPQRWWCCGSEMPKQEPSRKVLDTRHRIERSVERECAFLFGYLSAEMHGKAPKYRVQRLRLAVLIIPESVIVLEGAIGQPVLFCDCAQIPRTTSDG